MKGGGKSMTDREISISTANSRKDMVWKQEKLFWSEFIERLKTPFRSTETLEEYMKMPKAKQDDLKDVGGFVGGELKDGRRKNSNLLSRNLITLDLDNIQPGKTLEVLKKIKDLGVSYVVYSTRKHTESAPRLRVIFLANESMACDEYEPVARKIGSMIEISMCDPTTFEPARLMYWPSCSKDSNYIYEYDMESPMFDVKAVLKMYDDWRDMKEWPQVPGSEKMLERLKKKQENPIEKTGIIGAFCKTYGIIEAVNKFIPDVYEVSDDGKRMTYTGGSTYGGVVVYDDLFSYSHHATDPASGILCNAFDLVRIHKFSDLDADAKENTPNAKLPSFIEMSKLARGISEVANIVNAEIYNAKDDFEILDEEENDEKDLSWMSKFEITSNGVIKKTIRNVQIVLENDPHLKGKMALDEFSNRAIVLGSLPWNKSNIVRQYEEVDDSGLRNYLETKFGLSGEKKINDALLLNSHRNKFNKVKRYLENLKWDGQKRLETLLIDYLGAEDNVYTRAVIRVSLTAAVARAVEGGIKYDYMPIFTGRQGLGKSTFLNKLGMEWYSDSLQNFEGKEAAEMIQGTWINEIGELTGFNKTETNLIKQFLSKNEDIYREAYGRRTNKYPRRCVFFGTSNDWEFLRDRTGNRRFWPVVVGINEPRKSIWDDLDNEVDQIWAEAYENYKAGEVLMLTGEAEELSRQYQAEHRVSNPKEGIIQEFLDRKVPDNWNKLSPDKRRDYLSGNYTYEGDFIYRDRICAVEILVECFGMQTKNIRNFESSEINSIMESIPGWERMRTPRKFGNYGKQRGFKRVSPSEFLDWKNHKK